MLKSRIIPCLDVDNGRVVKGVNFLDLIDAGDPVKQAEFYSKEGADELCLLDITATSSGRETIFDIVEKVAQVCFIPFTVGGGVRKVEDIRRLLNSGADKVCINSAAVNDPEIVEAAARKFGSQCVVVAVDVKKIRIILRFTLMVDVKLLVLRFLLGQERWKALEREKFC